MSVAIGAIKECARKVGVIPSQGSLFNCIPPHRYAHVNNSCNTFYLLQASAPYCIEMERCNDTIITINNNTIQYNK
jgi:hypothetical protein